MSKYKSRYNYNLVWIDLEMTGLDIKKDVILEIATLVTNNELDILAKGPALVINQKNEILEQMSSWCIKHHTASGLVEAVKQSTITIEEAELKTLDFLKEYTVPEVSVLCGNSVWQDRNFIRKYMKNLDEFLNYRIIDVSSIKELVNRWYPNSSKSNFVKPDGHRALEDIIYSVEELKHYRTYFFLPPLE